ncbi:MAG: lmo0937 family membrane protein [Chitinophagales bacterium]
MGDILTIVAVILIIGWLVGIIGFGAAVGNFIHILLVLAIIAVLIRIISGRGV